MTTDCRGASVRQQTELASGAKVHARRGQRLRELELFRLIQLPHVFHGIQTQPFEDFGEYKRLVQPAGLELGRYLNTFCRHVH